MGPHTPLTAYNAMAYGISEGPYTSISVAPPTLIGALPIKPPKNLNIRIVCRFFASAVPMLNKQNARQPRT